MPSRCWARISLTRSLVCASPTRIASSALLDATADATASVATRTIRTTSAMPEKMRHASPNVRSVDVAIELVVFPEFVFVLDELVAARVELVLESREAGRRHEEVGRLLAAAIVPDVDGVLAGRYLLERELPVVVGLGEVRRPHRDHERHHLRVDVAVERIDARRLEGVVARLVLPERLGVERPLRRLRED